MKERRDSGSKGLEKVPTGDSNHMDKESLPEPEYDEIGWRRVNRIGSMDIKNIVEHKDSLGCSSGVTPSAPTPVKKMLTEALGRSALEGDSSYCDPSEFDDIAWDNISPPGSPRTQVSMGEWLLNMGDSLRQRRNLVVGVTNSDSNHEKEEISLDLPITSVKKCLYFSRGAMCVTYLGSLKDEKVVVKTVQSGCKHYSIAVNDIEVEMLLLKSLRHENIVTLKGAGLMPEKNRFIVLEYLSGDTLTKWIHGGTPRSLMKILDNSIGVCRALAYLHDHAIPGRIVIHRDLKPDNLVFSSQGLLKIIDFGLGKVVKRKYRVRSTMYQMTGGTGSLRYMAPEVANHKEYNEKVDVYSLCLILWEMIARTKPFLPLKRADFYARVIDQAERPDLDNLDCPETLTTLMRQTWHYDPHRRLSAREMLANLQAIAEEENQRHFLEYNQLELEMVDESPSSSCSNCSLTKTGSKRSLTSDLSYTQGILSKEKDYVPKYRVSRLSKSGSKSSSISTASLSSGVGFECSVVEKVGGE